jgi:hypothetical protein
MEDLWAFKLPLGLRSQPCNTAGPRCFLRVICSCLLARIEQYAVKQAEGTPHRASLISSQAHS